MRFHRVGAVGAVALAMAVLAGACGSGDSTKSSKSTTSAAPSVGTSTTTAKVKPPITIGAFDFGESEILANIYAGVLKKEGYPVTVKPKLGKREVVEPALQSGEIDMVPEYAGTVLEFLDKNAGQASGDLDATIGKLRGYYQALGVTVLDPSPAADQNAFGVTKATADQYHLQKTSDLAPVAAKFVLGGPPECPTRPFCQAGLEKVYGLKFKSFKALDVGGPLTKSALDSGAIQIGLILSSDGSIPVKGYVVLEDDKHLQTVDNVVPVVRTVKVDPLLQAAVNRASAALTTAKLVELNKAVDVDKSDPADVAAKFLRDNNLA